MRLNILRLIQSCSLALVLGGVTLSGQAFAQQQPVAQQLPVIRQISVSGNERVEPETIGSYLTVKVGDRFDPTQLDISLKNLFATGLFSDVDFQEQNGALIVRVVENPIINRVIFEGNKKLDNEELAEESRLRPRTVFTRAKVRSDVKRMLELYRNKGRFAAIIEPKVVQLEQNRVDLVFEIQEGPKTKVSRINFIGNKVFGDGDLRDVMATKESRWWKIFTSHDTFDPDRLAYDQQVLRNHYLNEGYADFRIVSAVSELTSDREDFFITFSVEEGEIYTFGEIKVESEIRDIDTNLFRLFVRMREGGTYNAEAIEQSIESLTDAAGRLGYAFVDIRPQINRSRADRTISITFKILDAPRVYVERINVHGNVTTLDRVIRREFRLQEGDAFNSARVTRSENRLKRLNFFRDATIERSQGSKPDRIVLDVNVEEQATGELNVGAGFSSIENFIFDFSIRQRNLFGKGQDLRLGLRLSSRSQEIDLGFTEPYFLGRRISAGFDIFARRFDNSRFGAAFNQDSIGFSLRAGMAINEFWTLSTRYTLRRDNVDLVDSFVTNNNNNGIFDTFFTGIQNEFANADAIERQELLDLYDTNQSNTIEIEDFSADGLSTPTTEELARAVPTLSRAFIDSLGSRFQSIIGYSVGFDTRNHIIRPTRGSSFYFHQDFAGLGGDVRYLRNRVNFDNYWTPWQGWTFRLGGEGGFITGLGQTVRVNDKFYIGGPRIRGFDNSGIGPRNFNGGNANTASSLGGTAFYIGRGELFFPLGDLALESGINASAFIDVGSLFRAQEELAECTFTRADFEAFQLAREQDPTVTFGQDTVCLSGNSPSPRISIGVGVSWQSPFGPFRIDLAKTIKQQLGDRPQTLQFNVGTTF
ncbi:outer membrane protein assembly factor BamA [Kordiimonas sp. SCSIO 12603]|uniref:outer membrane protein assembly factor BamA n=1 Tax=Kordiimonas sp. SCSIO 12603 TaxID=2829596 RepID=UPI0021038334|nr:outer membrane protein assembly factor BamA [Kordiimonas sp. SCSIO 12603]UTW57477.1 outer membrane protein assembly factor BamA [Kordiimonas sp. SCSIO 12603]